MSDDETINTLELLVENYVTLPESARVAGLDLARKIEAESRKSYFHIRNLINQLENVSKENN